MANTKLAIIDIDGMFYHSLRDSFKESLSTFKSKFENLLKETKATHYIGFYSMGKYFRHDVDPEYKGNRTGRPVAKYYKAIKEWAVAEYGFQYMKRVEADDLCAYWMNKNICSYVAYPYNMKAHEGNSQYWNLVDKVLCSPDKDLLKSIEGKHFNYSYKLEDKDDPNSVIKGWFVETSTEESHEFYAKQLLMGDSADGIQALSGVGTKRADKILENWNEGNVESFVLNIYIEFYKGDIPKAVFEFQKNYRLLHLLNTDEDFMREVGTIPTFPVITSIFNDIEEQEQIPKF